ncbi:MAG: hypothetical protein ACQERX_05935 [Bacillota bacterium]
MENKKLENIENEIKLAQSKIKNIDVEFIKHASESPNYLIESVNKINNHLINALKELKN